jgi:hypothetical protein
MVYLLKVIERFISIFPTPHWVLLALLAPNAQLQRHPRWFDKILET